MVAGGCHSNLSYEVLKIQTKNIRVDVIVDLVIAKTHPENHLFIVKFQ